MVKEKVLMYDDIHPGKYIIDSDGCIRDSLTREPITVRKNSNGYPTISLVKEDGKVKRILVHRLVAEHFIPKTYIDDFYGRDSVMFLDGNKENTKASNLKRVSNYELKILSDKRSSKAESCEECMSFITSMLKKNYSIEDILYVFDVKGYFDRRYWIKQIYLQKEAMTL